MDMFDGVGRRLEKVKGSWLDIGQHSLNGHERKVLFRNNGDGTFTDVAFVNGVDLDVDGRGLSVLDYDGDGRPDLLLRNYRQPAELFRNAGGGGHWLAVRLIGVRSNRDAVGARLRLQSARGWQTRQVSAGSGFLSSSSLVQDFGLGPETRVAELDVLWPSGARSVVRDLEADRRYAIVEGVEGAVADGPPSWAALSRRTPPGGGSRRSAP